MINLQLKPPSSDIGRVQRHAHCRGRGFAALPAAVLLLVSSSLLSAAPSQEDVFRSIQSNLDKPTDPTKLIGVLFAAVGLIVLVVLVSRFRQREVSAKPLNHHGKLIKELQRQVHIKPAELRQLRVLADGQSVDNPLTLLLCPSILVKAAKEKPDKFDRKLVATMLKRMQR